MNSWILNFRRKIGLIFGNSRAFDFVVWPWVNHEIQEIKCPTKINETTVLALFSDTLKETIDHSYYIFDDVICLKCWLNHVSQVNLSLYPRGSFKDAPLACGYVRELM